MEKIRQRRHGAEVWRGILGRFEESGMTAPEFSAHEHISRQSLYRWRARLGGESDQALVAKAAQLTNSKASGFIDLGDLRSCRSRLEVRLDLGAGVVLSIARG